MEVCRVFLFVSFIYRRVEELGEIGFSILSFFFGGV